MAQQSLTSTNRTNSSNAGKFAHAGIDRGKDTQICISHWRIGWGEMSTKLNDRDGSIVEAEMGHIDKVTKMANDAVFEWNGR